MNNNLMLHTITKFVFFIILTGSIHLFFAGHNNPGGGFIGGLMTAAAILLMYLSFGVKRITKAIPYNYSKIIAVGLLIAITTGLIGPLFGHEFLSHFYEYYDLPILGKTALATAVLFDLGVYLVVVGITLLAILTIGEDE